MQLQTLFTDVRNRNGTLYEGDSVLGKARKLEPLLDSKLDPEGEPTLDGPKLDWFPRWTKEDEEACSAPYGSYQEICTGTVEPYKPNDTELQESPFCLVQTTCKTVQGKQSSSTTVYYSKGKEKFENCNGAILVHPEGQRDNICASRTEKEINEIIASEQYGKVAKPRR